MKGTGLKLRRGTAFHVCDLRAFIGDDQSSFKLAKVLSIYTEICLKGLLHLNIEVRK